MHQLGLTVNSEMLQTPATTAIPSPSVAKMVSAVKGKPVEKFVDQLRASVATQKMERAQSMLAQKGSVKKRQVQDKVQKFEIKKELPPKIALPKMKLKETVILPKVAPSSVAMTPARSAAIRAQKVTKTRVSSLKPETVSENNQENEVLVVQKPLVKVSEEPVIRSSPRRKTLAEVEIKNDVAAVKTPLEKSTVKSLKEQVPLTPSPAKATIGKRKRVLEEVRSTDKKMTQSKRLNLEIPFEEEEELDLENQEVQEFDLDAQAEASWLYRVFKGVTTTLFFI